MLFLAKVSRNHLLRRKAKIYLSKDFWHHNSYKEGPKSVWCAQNWCMWWWWDRKILEKWAILNRFFIDQKIKTAFLRVLAQQNYSGPSTSTQEQVGENGNFFANFMSHFLIIQYFPTQEDDTYHIQLCSGGSGNVSREFVLFHDTPGIPDFGNIELKKAYLQVFHVLHK